MFLPATDHIISVVSFIEHFNFSLNFRIRLRYAFVSSSDHAVSVLRLETLSLRSAPVNSGELRTFFLKTLRFSISLRAINTSSRVLSMSTNILMVIVSVCSYVLCDHTKQSFFSWLCPFSSPHVRTVHGYIIFGTDRTQDFHQSLPFFGL